MLLGALIWTLGFASSVYPMLAIVFGLVAGIAISHMWSMKK